MTNSVFPKTYSNKENYFLHVSSSLTTKNLFVTSRDFKRFLLLQKKCRLHLKSDTLIDEVTN